MLAKVQVYILSKDRPDYLRDSLKSVMAQESFDFQIEVIVSDNSETNIVHEMLSLEFPKVLILKRSPNFISLHEHCRCVIEESTGEFLVIFHDDDILLPNYLNIMMRVIRNNPTASAVGCNSFFFYDEERYPNGLAHRFKNQVSFSDNFSFLMQNLCDHHGIAPFPGYLYRKKFLNSSFINLEDGGKYQDVSFLSKLLDMGELIWIPDVLMLTRIHRNNDSGTISIPGKLKLIRYMISKGVNRKSVSMRRYKFEYWRIWFREHGLRDFSIKGSWRVRVIRKFLFSFALFRVTQFFYYQSIMLRIKSRFVVDRRLKKTIDSIKFNTD